MELDIKTIEDRMAEILKELTELDNQKAKTVKLMDGITARQFELKGAHSELNKLIKKDA